MASKVSLYPTTATTLNAVDLFDVSVRISTSPDVWESQKIPYSTVRTLMTNTLSEVLAADNETNGHNIIVTGGDLIQSTVTTNFIDLAASATDILIKTNALIDLQGIAVQYTSDSGVGAQGKLYVDATSFALQATPDCYITSDGFDINIGTNVGTIILTGDTDAPAHNISAVALKVKGAAGAGYLGLKHQSAGITVSASESGIYANSTGSPFWKNDSTAVAEIALKKDVNTSAVNDTFFSGQWHYPIGSGARTAITVLSGIIWLIPYYVGRDRTVTDIGVNLSAGVAGGNVRLAIYDSDGTGGRPKTRLVDSGNIAATTSGFKSALIGSTVSLLSSHKLYWLGLQTSSGTIGVYYTQMISAILDQAQNANTSMHVLAQAFGAFPADVSAAVFNTSVLNFQIGLKIA